MNKATSAPQLAPGTVIDGMYTLGEALRSRVGAVTYEAADPNDKKVEVTVYRADSFMNPMAIERALRELRQVSTVDDPRVIHVFDSGKLKDGGVYEVHEHAPGKTLAELEAMEPTAAAQVLKDIVAALEAANRAGVIHRNLGPDVVIRTDDGVKVGGFAVGEPQGGVSFGAIECIAPEQVEGKNVDEPTLVYNLASLAYRLLHGKPIFVGDVATQLLQHAASTPPGDAHPVLVKALSKDAKARPSLSDLAGDLGKLSEGPRPKPAAPAAAFGGFGKVGAPPITRPGAAAAPPPRLGAPPAGLSSPPTTGRTLFGGPGSGPKPAAAPSLKPPGLPTLGGAPPPATTGAKPGAKPRTRGWTMFMEATDDESAPPSSTGAPAVPAAPSAPSLGAPSVAPAAAKAPTMGAPSVPAPTIGVAPAAAPSLGAPSVAAPSLGAPSIGAPSLGAPSIGAPSIGAPSIGAPSLGAPSIGAPSLGAPSLGAPSLGAPSLGAPSLGAPSLGAPSLGAPSLGAPAAAPAAGAAPVESKPSVRGWTLIMDDPDEAAAATPAIPAPTAAPASPSTRGWTMLEELNDSPAAAGAGVPMSESAAEAAAAAPTSRGWTMFMEAELEGEKAAAGEGEAPAATEAAAEPESESDYYDGPITTDAGTVVAFAPEAPTPTARPTPAPAPSKVEEPLSSFASKLRGEEEPIASFASKLRGEDAAAEPEESLEDLAKQATTPTVEATPAATPRCRASAAAADLRPTAADRRSRGSPRARPPRSTSPSRAAAAPRR
ncbi:MAG: hypothetical protein R3B09_29455 [Nannocystaceae bacterium]